MYELKESGPILHDPLHTDYNGTGADTSDTTTKIRPVRILAESQSNAPLPAGLLSKQCSFAAPTESFFFAMYPVMAMATKIAPVGSANTMWIQKLTTSDLNDVPLRPPSRMKSTIKRITRIPIPLL